MTSIYQVEVYNYPTTITVTGDTKEEAVIKAREEFRLFNGGTKQIYKTKIIYIEKC